MNYLITGGAGFIGSHLSQYLINKGHEVIVVDNLSTGSYENTSILSNDPKYSFHVCDIGEDSDLFSILIDQVDIIIHLAATVGVKSVINNPARTMEINLRGTETVLKAATKKCKRVLIASTSQVYGPSSETILKEDHHLVLEMSIKGQWSYVTSKIFDELMGMAYWKEKNVPVTICRFFNVAGPRQTANYCIPAFVKSALREKDLQVYGTGMQTRCFIHVKDIVRAIHDLTQINESIGDIFNVGAWNEISVLDLATTIISMTESSSEIEFVSGSEVPHRRIPDITKINNLIGYRPELSMNDILYDVIEFERTKL